MIKRPTGRAAWVTFAALDYWTQLKTTFFPAGIPAERTPRAERANCAVWGEVPRHQQPSAAEQGAGAATAGEGKKQNGIKTMFDDPQRVPDVCVGRKKGNSHLLNKKMAISRQIRSYIFQ